MQIARPDDRHRLLPARRAGRQQLARRRRRRAAAALAAPVLVLFPPGRLHHDPAGDGHGLGHHQHASPASRCSATSRWSTRSPASPAWASSSGGITCSCRGMNPRLGMTFMVATMMIALPSAVKVFNWLGTICRRQHPVHHAPCSSPCRFVSLFIIGGLSRHLHGGHAGRHLHPRHLFHRRPLPLRAVRRQAVRRLRRHLFLVPQDVRPHDERILGQDPLLPDVHLLQRHVLPHAHSGGRRLAAPPGRHLPLSDLRRTCSR